MNDTKFWEIVEKCGWSKSTDYKAIRKMLEETYSNRELCEFRDMLHIKYNKLYKTLDKVVTNLGDDSFDDLLYHIIGLGREEYDKVMKTTAFGVERAKAYNFVESFVYACR